MTVRNYSPEEIDKVRAMALIPEKLREERIVLLARELKKPIECIKKRLDFEVKEGNIKTEVMTRIENVFNRYSEAEKKKIKDLMDVPEGDARLKAIDRLAKELDRTSDAIYQKLGAMLRKERREKRSSIKRVRVTKVENQHISNPVPSNTVVNNSQVKIKFKEIKIDMENNEIILSL